MANERIVIVGAGHAGGRVAQHLCDSGYAGDIVLIGDEAHPPYERPALSKEVLKGERSTDEIGLASAEYWSACGQLKRVIGRVDAIDAETRSVVLQDGSMEPFDKLVVATGGRARSLALPGADAAHVLSLRTLDDCLQLQKLLQPGSRVVVIGAGVIGMEVAATAQELGARVTVLEAGSRALARCVPALVSQWLQSVHQDKGVALEFGVQLNSIEHHENGSTVHAQRAGASLAFDADVVLLAIGIDCAVPFLQGTGIAAGNGIPVNEFCASSIAPWCYAVGDVALTDNRLYQRPLRQETWRNAENQAKAVAEFLQGRTVPYCETPWMWTDQFGYNIQVVGLPQDDADCVVREQSAAGPETVLMLKSGKVLGGVLVNKGKERKHLEKLVEKACVLSAAQAADASVSLRALAS